MCCAARGVQSLLEAYVNDTGAIDFGRSGATGLAKQVREGAATPPPRLPKNKQIQGKLFLQVYDSYHKYKCMYLKRAEFVAGVITVL